MDLATRAIGAATPARTVAAGDTDAVVSAVRDANEAGEAVVVWGGGTRIEVGDDPERYDAALDLRALRGVVEHAPADLVCTVRAGTTLAELADVLAAAGQRWPVEVGDPATATVGGSIASAAAGPSRLRYQHPRDWIIGCEAVLGDGTRTRAGGRVVKNVTGYDLTRLYSGTFGTLAVLTEVTLKLVARAERVRSFTLAGAPSEVWRSAGVLHASRLPLDAVALVIDAAGARLVVRVAGSVAAVDRLAAELRRLGHFAEEDAEAWGAIAALPLRAARSARLSLRPGREAEVFASESGPLLAYPGTGIAYLFGELDPRRVRALRELVEPAGGALVIERAAPETRRAAGTWGTPRLPPAIARGLKGRFDPRGVLAPGRLPA